MPTNSLKFRRTAGIALTVAALGLGVVACGGGDDEETPAPVTTTTTTEETVTLTTEDLITEGDAICAEANSALGSIEASTVDDTTKSTQVADIYDGIAQQLGELGTPSDGEPPTDVIAAAQELADGTGDTTAFQTAASEYGFTDCAEAPEAVAYPTDSAGTDSSTATDSTDTYVPPATDSTDTYVPPTTTAPPTTGGGVAPTTPDTGGSSTGGSSGGTSSGGIGPG